MWRCSLTFGALLSLMTMGSAQHRPKLSLVLPPGTASETVQIQYFLSGAFGGYGSFVRAEKNRSSYDIDPFVGGRPARGIKIIAYLPGCEITAFDIEFVGTPVERQLDCSPIGTVLLRGQIPSNLVCDAREREIQADYLAMWSHRFYGIFDGPITEIRLGTAQPDPDGKFEITLPNFYQQPLLRDGGLQFILRDAKTGNIVSFLRPEDAKPNSPDWLTVRDSYPIIQLVARREKQPKKPDSQ